MVGSVGFASPETDGTDHRYLCDAKPTDPTTGTFVDGPTVRVRKIAATLRDKESKK